MFKRIATLLVVLVAAASLLGACSNSVKVPSDSFGGQSLSDAGVTVAASNTGIFSAITINVIGLNNTAKVGQKIQYMAYGWTPQNTYREINTGSGLASWTSSDPNIAFVNAWGGVVGISPGSCTIKASLYGVTSNLVTVTVTP